MCVNTWKVPSGGRAEIENIKNSAICDIFNFSFSLPPDGPFQMLTHF